MTAVLLWCPQCGRYITCETRHRCVMSDRTRELRRLARRNKRQATT